MNWFSSFSVYIILTQTSLVLSKRGFEAEEMNIGLTASEKREIKIRELCDRLGIKYGELLARNKHHRNMRQLKPRISTLSDQLEIPERQLISDFLDSQGSSRTVSPQKKTIIPTTKKSKKKMKLNLENLSKMFKLSPVNKINKEIKRTNSIFKQTEKPKIKTFQSNKKSLLRQIPEKYEKTEHDSGRRSSKPRMLRLNIFNKFGKYSEPERQKIKLNISMLSRIAEKSRSNKKQVISDRTVQMPTIKQRLPDRNTQATKNKQHILVSKIQRAKVSNHAFNRITLNPQISFRSKFDKPERRNILIPIIQKSSKQKSRLDLPDKKIQKPMIKLRSKFGKHKRRNILIPVMQKSSAQKIRLDLPETQIRNDVPERRIKTPSKKLRSWFGKQGRRNSLVPSIKTTPIMKTRHDTSVRQTKPPKIKLRSKFEKPVRKSILRQFINTIKKRKNKFQNKRVLITTEAPIAERRFTTRRSSITTKPTTSTTTQTTTSSTKKTRPPPPTTTTFPPPTTITSMKADTIDFQSKFDFIDQITNTVTKVDNNNQGSDVTRQKQKVHSNLNSLKQTKKISIKTPNPQKGKSRVKLNFSSFPTSSVKTTTSKTSKRIQPTEIPRLRLDFSNFLTVRTTTANTRSPTTNQINALVRPTVGLTTPKKRLNLPGIQGSKKSKGTTLSKRPGTTKSSTTSSKVFQKSTASKPAQPTGQTSTTRIRLTLPSVPSTSSHPVGVSTLSSLSGTDTTKQSELGNIETEILNHLRKTPEFIRASRVNTPEADMKLKEVLDGLLINFSTKLPTVSQLTTTNKAHSSGQTTVPVDNTIPIDREIDLKHATKQNRAMLIPKRFSQTTVSHDAKTNSGVGESDWMFIESELNKFFPE